MCHLIAFLLPVWHECNYGFVVDGWIDGLGHCRHEPNIITHFIFADNLWLVASSPIVLHKIVQSLTSLQNSRMLLWKASDMKVMTISIHGSAGFHVDTLD